MRRLAEWLHPITTDEAMIEPHGLSTGFKDLDHLLQGGLQVGELTCLAARSGMGKTALALNLAINIAQNNQHLVCFLSSETRPQQLANRLLSLETGLPLARLTGQLGPEQAAQITQAQQTLTKLNFSLETVYDFEAILGLLEAEANPPALVIVDSLVNLIFADQRPQSEQIQLGLTRLKAWALEYHSHVIVTGTLLDSGEQRIEEKLSLEALYPSCLRQICDNIALLNHDDGERQTMTASIWLAKQRQGIRGQVLLDYDRSLGRFSGLDF